jgi:hypothetical protein
VSVSVCVHMHIYTHIVCVAVDWQHEKDNAHNPLNPKLNPELNMFCVWQSTDSIRKTRLLTSERDHLLTQVQCAFIHTHTHTHTHTQVSQCVSVSVCVCVAHPSPAS